MTGPATLVDILAQRAADKPDHRAYIFLTDHGAEEASLTYVELATRATALAARLTAAAAPGERVIFAATGVTDGSLMRGVRFFGYGTRTSSVIMQNEPHRIRFIDSIPVNPATDVRIRF